MEKPVEPCGGPAAGELYKDGASDLAGGKLIPLQLNSAGEILPSDKRYRRILGINFFTGRPEQAAAFGLRGGLVVAPSAPGLAEMPFDRDYVESLLKSDLAITDSGLMVLIWQVMKSERITRISGLEYLKLILQTPAVRAGHAILWVMPSAAAQERNLRWLRQQGFPTTEDDCYIAPNYDPMRVVDPKLLEFISARRPAHIIIGVSGGIQEKLGFYLKQNASYHPAIHCIGAAIGFLSGEQVPIPMWADYLMLGWLLRCLSKPKRFIPRYWKALRLVPLMLKYQDRVPEPAR